MVRGEHRAEDRQGRVEARVREGNRLGVALEQGDAQALGLDAAAAAREQGRDVVDPDRVRAAAGGGDRRVAAAARDIEDAPAGLQVGRVAERVCDGLDQGRDGVEVAARPHLLLALLDLLEVGAGLSVRVIVVPPGFVVRDRSRVSSGGGGPASRVGHLSAPGRDGPIGPGAQTSPSRAARAAAAARVGSPSLRRMFATCRCTVCGLTTSSDAISRLLRPVATSASTSRSRRVSSPSFAAGAGRPSSRAAEIRSWRASSSRNVSWARARLEPRSLCGAELEEHAGEQEARPRARTAPRRARRARRRPRAGGERAPARRGRRRPRPPRARPPLRRPVVPTRPASVPSSTVGSSAASTRPTRRPPGRAGRGLRSDRAAGFPRSRARAARRARAPSPIALVERELDAPRARRPALLRLREQQPGLVDAALAAAQLPELRRSLEARRAPAAAEHRQRGLQLRSASRQAPVWSSTPRTASGRC